MKRYLEDPAARQVRKFLAVHPELVPEDTNVMDVPIYLGKTFISRRKGDDLPHREKHFRIIYLEKKPLNGICAFDPDIGEWWIFEVRLYCEKCGKKQPFCFRQHSGKLECPFCATLIKPRVSRKIFTR